MGSLTANEAVAPALSATVLVVNADPAGRERIAALLGAAGMAVESCASAAEALARLRRLGCDVMVVDLVLEDMSGIELLGLCREAGLGRATVMTTSSDEISAAVRAVRAGVIDYLPPPLDGRLVQAVQQAL
ncbi:MAG: response regulator [Gammaproteobacteria bacterium]